MKLEQQCVSLELAKKLKELGVKENSYFRWQVWTDIETGRKKKQLVRPGEYNFGDAFPAFTVAELGEMLPSEVHFFTSIKNPKRRKNAQHIHFFHGRDWAVNYTGGGAIDNYTQCGETEADVRAKMLIYLIENKLITL